MAKEETYRAKATQALSELLDYRGSAAYGAVIHLLDALDDCYREEMLTVKPDWLLHKQGAAAQVRLIRDAMVFTPQGKITDLPKV